MPSLNPAQFREFSIERSVAARNEADPYAHARGYQNFSSNIYAPSFSGDYNSPAEHFRSPAAAESYGEDEDEDEEDE